MQRVEDYPVEVKRDGKRLGLTKSTLKVFHTSTQHVKWVSEEGTLELRFVDSDGPFEVETLDHGKVLRAGLVRKKIPVGAIYKYELLVKDKDGRNVLSTLIGYLTVGASASEGVKITLNAEVEGKRTLSVDRETVWVKKGEDVEWECVNDDGRLRIEFKSTSPFPDLVYEGVKKARSKKRKDDADQKIHDYTITLFPSDGGDPVVLDPGVGVDDDSPDD